MCWSIPEVNFLQNLPVRVKRTLAISSGKTGEMVLRKRPEKNAGNPLDLF
jgi:hypothetical protein